MAKKIQYHFVLQKEDIDSGLKEHMDGFAKQKKLTARIKTALTLLAQLEQGNYEMLDSMFPQARPKPETPPAPPNTGDIELKLERIERMLIERQGIPDDAPLVASPPKKLAAGQGNISGASKPMQLPSFDDDDDDLGETMIIKKAESKPMNMVLGIMSIVEGAGLQGKNHTADANAKSLAGRREH